MSDPRVAAEEAGLRYTSDARPGIRRVRCGKGFRYVDPEGQPVREGPVLDRIRALVIPPAWTDVWITTDPRGHLQATGRDARGRKQYRYHDRWRESRDADKYDRLAEFGGGLGDLRAQVDADLGAGCHTREHVLALVVRLLDETLVRVGNAEYANDNETYGLTTLRPRHVALRPGRVTFEFIGKGGIEHDVTVADRRLSRLVARCHELGGQELFSYVDEAGELCAVDSEDVNAYLRRHLGPDSTAKGFRTWGGTVLVAERLVESEPGPTLSATAADKLLLDAIDAAAARLGNTRTVCRQSYLHPVVPEAFRSGALHETWTRVRTGTRLRRAERLVLELLGNPAAAGAGGAARGVRG
jgi:DNA topoisomerase I